MKKIVALVEGPGDVSAVPVLLRKLLKQDAIYDWQPGDMMKVGELPRLRKRLADLAGALRNKMQEGGCHGALVLLDLDDADNCPVTEARKLALEFSAFGLPYPVAIVFARREFEEWLVASLPSIAPATPLLPDDLHRDYPPEEKRNVKGWLEQHFPSYRPDPPKPNLPATSIPRWWPLSVVPSGAC